MGKCIYCKGNIEDDRAVDVCDMCGRKVWGDKMFSAIKNSMGDAKKTGNLEQGSISAGAGCPPKLNKL